ncbi:hypothetical protein ACSTS3_18430 [Aquimarina muelleri]|uniref:hypothetical protein n=1 Tax=Aquimarina muelleri TaxID=279356 RepID=UPI003F682478
MNKLYLLTTSILLSIIPLNAQDLANKIPKEVNAVVSIKGGNLTELFSIQDFGKTVFGKKIEKELSRKEKSKTLLESGIDIASTGYYFYEATDSIQYHCALVPIKNSNQFESLFSRPEKITTIKGQKAFYKKYDKTSIMVWNDKMMLFINGKVSKSYFSNNKVRKQYDLPIIENENHLHKYGYYDIFESRSQEKDITFQYLTDKIDQIFNTPLPSKESILSNRDYLKAQNKNAEISIWVSDIMKVYSNILKESNIHRYSALLLNGIYSGKYGNQDISGHMFLEEKEIKANITYHMDKEMGGRMKKIYSNSLNKKFLNYINEEEILGYASYVINTEEFLTEYPKMIQNTLGDLYKAETDILADLLSIVLDEKAIGKVIKGDALFLMYDLNDKEVAYKTYEYDEEYNYKEIEKTRTETIPDFLLLLSSGDTDLIKKIFDYGQEKGIVSLENGVYRIKYKTLPTEIYVNINQEIITIGNNKERVIKNNTINKKVSKKHKQILQNSSSSIFINTQEIVKVAKAYNSRKKTERKLEYLFNNVEDIQLTTSKVKNNKMSIDLKMELPTGHKNGLQYLITLLEEMNK